MPEAPVETSPLVDRRLLEKLETLTLRWQRSYRGLVGGHNPSRYAGPGQEFLDHRNFHPGDDLRAVNWRAYMRLDKLFLKMFQTEPRTPVRLLLDASLSMTAGVDDRQPAMRKWDYARKVAAALTYVGLVRHDSMVLQPFHERLDDNFVASGGRHRFGPVSDFLKSLEARGQSNFYEIARQFIGKYQKPGLLILISDFLEEGDLFKPLQYLADFGHELLLLQLWTPFDRDPGADGDLALSDAESGAALELSFDAEARARYVEAFDRHAEAIEALAMRNNGRYAGLSTAMALEEAVFQILDMNGAPAAARRGA
jgi:uncharacterized protein (DUF58 family)